MENVRFQVNFSLQNAHLEGSGAPVDPWHWDSVSYTGVIILSEMDDMVGGELELMNMDKREGLQLLVDDKYEKGVHSSVIGYKAPGNMIFAQGSEILHHVTPIKSDHRR